MTPRRLFFGVILLPIGKFRVSSVAVVLLPFFWSFLEERSGGEKGQQAAGGREGRGDAKAVSFEQPMSEHENRDYCTTIFSIFVVIQS